MTAAATPRYAWYGDDFTGASDTLATLAAAGRRALLFLAPPSPTRLAAAGPLDALGIAGIARALDPAAMAAEMRPVARCFADLAPDITHYKCCSTFDSAVTVGNLVHGLEALRRPEHEHTPVVLGGQPSLGRHCAFGTLFATAQAGGEVHRIDRHPTMRSHPVTPMHEADLRRHLETLGLPGVALIDLRALDAAVATATVEPIQRAVMERLSARPRALLFDTTRDAHLGRIGQWLWERARQRPQRVLGASSVAQAALAHWPGMPDTSLATVRGATPAASPVFLLVGSLSPVTAAQAAHARGAYHQVLIDPSVLLHDAAAASALARHCSDLLAQGRSVMARTTAPATDAPPPLTVAGLCARLLAEVIGNSPQVRRVGVAGGDTSSLAVRALPAWGLAWQGELGTGVPLLRLHADDAPLDGLELMLKGGQMGPPDVFMRLRDGAPPF